MNVKAQEVDAQYNASYTDDADYIPQETVYRYEGVNPSVNFYNWSGGLFHLKSDSGRRINAFCIDFNTGTNPGINYIAKPISQAGSYAEPYVDYLSIKDGVSIKDRLKTIVNNVNKNSSDSVGAAQILIWHTVHGGTVNQSGGKFYATFPSEVAAKEFVPRVMLWARERGNTDGRALSVSEKLNDGQCKIKIKDVRSKLGHSPVVTVYKSKIDIRTGEVLSKGYATDAASGEVLKGKVYNSDIEMYLEPYDKSDYEVVKYNERYLNGRYYYEEKREYTTYNSYHVYVDGVLVSRRTKNNLYYNEPLVFKDRSGRLQNNWYYEYILIRTDYKQAATHAMSSAALSEYNRLKSLADTARPGYDGDIKAKFNFYDVNLDKIGNKLELTYKLRVSSDHKLQYLSLPELNYFIPGQGGEVQLNTIGNPTVQQTAEGVWSIKASIDGSRLQENEDSIRISAKLPVKNLTAGEESAIFALVSDPLGKQNLISTDTMENRGSLVAEVDVKIIKYVNLTIDKTWENDLDIKNNRGLTLIIKRSVEGGTEETFAEVTPVLNQERTENVGSVSFKVKTAPVGENNWRIELKGLPKRDGNGKTYKYSIVEKATPAVSKYISKDTVAETTDNISFKLVNKVPYSLDVYINKVGVVTLTDPVPTEIAAISGAKFELSYNAHKAGEYTKLHELTVDTAPERNVFKGLKEGYYSLKEIKAPDNYVLDSEPILFEIRAENGKAVLKTDAQYKDASGNGIKVRNKVKEISISVEKLWNADEKNRSDITIQVIDRNTREVKRSKIFTTRDNIWAYTFDKLPILDKNGQPIEYDVIERGEENGIVKTGSNEYRISKIRNADGTGFTVTNTVTGKVKLTVDKQFIGAKANKTYVGVFRADELIDVLTIDNTSGSSVSREYDKFDKDYRELVYTVKELDTVKENLNESIKNVNAGYRTVEFEGISYKVLENKNYIVDNNLSYQADYYKAPDSDTYRITNTEVFKIGIRKVWANDNGSHRPVEIGIYDGEMLKQKLTVAGSDIIYTDWLPRYGSNRELVNYTVRELAGTEAVADNGIIVIDGNKYKVSVNKTGDNGSTALYTVTNTLKNGIVANADKQWIGNSKRQSITAYLYIKDTASNILQYTGISNELNEGNGYQAVFDRLDELSGNRIYVVREEAGLDGQTDRSSKEIRLSGTAYDVRYKDELKNGRYTTTISNSEKLRVQADKVWIGRVADNAEVKLGIYADGKFNTSDRLDIIRLNKLSQSATTPDGKTIWSAYSNKELPKYDASGIEIRYVVRELGGNDEIKEAGSVTEIANRHYRVEYKGNQAINTEVIKIKADKEWLGEAPDSSLTLDVYNSKGSKVDSITISKDSSAGNNRLWHGASNNWLAADDTYTVKESNEKGEFKAGEIISIGENSYRIKKLQYADGRIIAANEQLTVVKGTKKFNGAAPAGGIKVALFIDDNGVLDSVAGVEPKTIRSSNEEFKFENLPTGHTYVVRELDKNGSIVENGAVAEMADGYSYKVEYTGQYDITNTRTGDVEISATKKWIGTSGTAKIGVFKGDEVTPVHIFNITGNDTQSVKLPGFDERGMEISYVIKEMDENRKAGSTIVIDGRRYTIEYSDGNIITNTEQKVDVSVEKRWIRKDGAAVSESDMMPIEIFLYKKSINDTKYVPTGHRATLNKGNWSHTFTDLPAYENGQPLVYSAIEVIQGKVLGDEQSLKLSNGDTYTAKYDLSVAGKVIITNVVETDATTVDIPFIKRWNNLNGSAQPDSITVRLLSRPAGTNMEFTEVVIGGVKQEKTVDASSGWKGTFEKLPARNSDKKILEYKVEEVAVAGFVPVYDMEDIDGVNTQVITNVSVPKLSKTDRKGRPAGGARFELWRMTDIVSTDTSTAQNQPQDGSNTAATEPKSYDVIIGFAVKGGNDSIPVKAVLMVNGEAYGDEEMLRSNGAIGVPVVLKDTDVIAARFIYPSNISLSKDSISFDKDSRIFTLKLPENMAAAQQNENAANNAENPNNTDAEGENAGATSGDTSENVAEAAASIQENAAEEATAAATISEATDFTDITGDGIQVATVLTEMEIAEKSGVKPQYERIAEIVSADNGAIDLDQFNLQDGKYYLVELSAPTSRPAGSKAGDYWEAADPSIKYEFIIDNGNIVPQSDNIKEVIDSAHNTVGYRIENNFIEVPNDPPETPPTPPEIPYIPPNTPETPVPEIPDDPEVPDIEISDSDIPLSVDDDFFVSEDDIPLGGLPKTGNGGSYIMIFLTACAAIGGLLVVRNKKRKAAHK